ncbi:MAG: hypothetical protein ACD_81C00089G0022 [uncultured bacterium]|uniref:Prepilin-type N-terminal cleavage/methylation domain-containing protein n=1 Tax=Candidatus Wolfebacteria bacterium GW2011_GWE2_44_13 TaxID=1619017 RepID=A0A0G1HAF7_9BACT|nr:MAG: hypothetical protein ACD_81C00089G0022 [uncultured bacterium]KKT43533.1 MAG: hypothetical protein UW32_C0001G0125 [Candidatus Wolfebacteria bacterium GW2011_GWE2_44_13]
MSRRGFTLLELLIVIGILSVLATTAALVINPLEYLRQSRDAKRIADSVSMYKAIQLLSFDNKAATTLGTISTVYISLPDTASSTCGSYALPALPAPWQYHCASDADFKKNDGTGWMPVDFSALTGGSPLHTLPIDPNNSIANAQYYSFVTDGDGYELAVSMEASTNTTGGATDKTSSDGGDNPTSYELGSNLVIAPWSFEFTGFPVVALNSNLPGWYKHSGTGTALATGDAQNPHYLQVSGPVLYGWQQNIPFNPDSVYKIECRARQETLPTTGGRGAYCGFFGIAANGTTGVSTTGASSYSAHYRTFSNTTLAMSPAWTTASGYTKGHAATGVNGTSGTCISIAAPCKMHANVRFVRPMFMVNYNLGDGIMNFDYIKVTKI